MWSHLTIDLSSKAVEVAWLSWFSSHCVCERAQSHLTFCDPKDCSPPGSSVYGIFQARVLEWVPLPSPGDLLDIARLQFTSVDSWRSQWKLMCVSWYSFFSSFDVLIYGYSPCSISETYFFLIGVTPMVKICLECRRTRFSPWVRKIPWRRKWQPLQYSCLENPMDRGAWRAIVHRIPRVRHNLATKPPLL